MGIFSFFNNKKNSHNSDNESNYSDISKELVDLVIYLLKEKSGGVRVEDGIALLSTVIGERCIEAAGEYSIYDHDKIPGQIIFSDKINIILYGDRVTEKISELTSESVLGQIRDLLIYYQFKIEDFPPINQLIKNFAAGIGKEEDWGKCPWTVPKENMPSILPLQVGFETRNAVDKILGPAPDKIQKLKISIQALCSFLAMAKKTINHQVAILLALETINGMSKTAPMTVKAMQQLILKQNQDKNKNVDTTNKYEKACKDYTDAISQDPKNAKLYLERARAYESLQKYDLALLDLTAAIRIDPQKSYFYYFLRHNQYMRIGDPEKALEDVKQAVALAPDGYNYYGYLGKVYKKLGQIDNAVTALNQGVEKNPASRDAYLERAAFYEEMGCLEEALKDITKAIDVNPKWLNTFHYRARIYIKLGQFDNALKDCNKCIEIEPKEWTHFRVRSEVYKAMGDEISAKADYMTSMELNPCINR
ncbi:MAG TPA: tetratricopeptide repeat protein [Clostridia bacterium]